MRRIAVFVGTRPEIIKMATVAAELQKRLSGEEFSLVHTGQHYDWEMSEQFLQELDIPKPDEFLGVGSGSQGDQLAKTVKLTEDFLQKQHVKLVAVEGDTNSALGVALAAAKNDIAVAHVEAGCRCFDKSMPEEINRVLIADCADLNLAPTKNCVGNLLREGIPKRRVVLSGHPLVTLLKQVASRIDASTIQRKLSVSKGKYALLTTHRQENVDDKGRLKSILDAAGTLPTKIVFPIHPRTEKNVQRFGLNVLLKPFKKVAPLGYLDTLRLVRDAELVITDSGGLQQEAFLFRTPCITLRERTEWIETLEGGGNLLVPEPRQLGAAYNKITDNYKQFKARIRDAGQVFGDSNSALRNAEAILSTNRPDGIQTP